MRIRGPFSLALAFSCVLGLGACEGETGSLGEPALVRPAESEGSSADSGVATLEPGSEVVGPSSAIRVTFLGTSLTEGLGLERPAEEAWPARVGELADSAGIAVEIVNGGIGGETSAGALGRIDWVLQGEPDVLVIETGANDGLRGLPVAELEANLTEIIRIVKGRRPELPVAIVQMEAPTNMGADYTNAFRAVFPAVAERTGVPRLPFLLGGIGGIPELNQGDGIHPTAEGHRMMARNVWTVLEPMLRAASQAQDQAGARP